MTRINPRCDWSQGRRSWVVANHVLCLTYRQWITPPSRVLRLTREAETDEPVRRGRNVEGLARPADDGPSFAHQASAHDFDPFE